MASQITSLIIVYSAVYPGADQRKHQSPSSLAFVWGIHRSPVNSPHKWSVTRKLFPFDDVIMGLGIDLLAPGISSLPPEINSLAPGINSLALEITLLARGINSLASGINSLEPGINSLAPGTNSLTPGIN